MELNIFFDNGILNKNKIRESWVKKNHIGLYNDIIEYQKTINVDIVKFSQSIWHYKNKIRNYPNCEYCGLSNKRFYGLVDGYKRGCSRSCAIQISRPKSIETRKKNTIEKYGVDHTTKLESVRNKMRETNLERYGVEYAAQNNNIMNSITSTNLERYGVEYPIQNEDIRNDMVDTIYKKYGVDNVSKSTFIKNKKIKNSLEKWGTEHHISSEIIIKKIKKTRDYNLYKRISDVYNDHKTINLDSISDGVAKFDCGVCNESFEITLNLLHQRFYKNNIDICLNCNPLNNKNSSGHLEIFDFIKSLSIDNIILNDRKMINPYELDIYLPDYRLAIEFNGVYWHSDLIKNKNYHIDKLNRCNEEKIELIQIWEDDWINKSEIIKSILSNKLNKTSKKIGARNCEIMNVSSNDSKLFLEKNHIQGWSVSKWRIGLYYDSELVSLMTFGRGRKNMGSNGDEYELIRFCNRLDTNVIGGMSKLYKYFLKSESPNKIISYCDMDIFSGESYLLLGMELESHSINYTWCDGRNRYNRWNFRKDKLVSEGYDSNKTESEIMISRGWWKCWGSGNNKYIFNNK